MCWCFIDYWLKNARWNIEKRISSCLHRLWRWNRQSVPKRRHIHFSRRGITQKKEYNIQYTANVWNQECTRYMPACILLESGFIWAETCSCHWALNNEQLVADGSLLASFIFVIVSIWTLLPCKIHRVSDGELLHFLYYFWGAAVQVLCITVTRICDLHLVFGSGPGWLRLYCSWLSIRRAEAQKKGAKTSPCPLIHPALQATALSFGWSARDRWLHAGVVAYIGALIPSAVLDYKVTVTPLCMVQEHEFRPTALPPTTETLSYDEDSTFGPCWYQSVAYVIKHPVTAVSGSPPSLYLSHPPKILLQRCKQTTVARQRIPQIPFQSV